MRVIYVPVRDLAVQDRVLSGSVIGSVKLIDDLVVKNIAMAEQNKFAITMYRLGTIFAHGDTVVKTLSDDDDDDDDDENGSDDDV